MKYRIDYKRLLLVLLTVLFSGVFLRWGIISCTNSDAKANTIQPLTTESIPLSITFSRKEAQPVPVSEATASPISLINVYNHREDKLETMSLEDYIFSVVSAEMPASYETEALKAQAVAARTFSCYCILHRGCGSNDEADVCTNSQCCQAYADTDKLKQNWGDNYEKNAQKIRSAVEETKSMVMLYEGKPIEALFHACSGGSTENSENVFSAARPYLRAVVSQNEVGSRQNGEVRLSLADLIEKVNKAYPKAKLKMDGLIEQVGIVSTFPSGRVENLKIGETNITGKQTRKLFGLDSTMFIIMFTDDEIVFMTKGYGHGVGMSQSGANGMAKDGEKYEQILLHYYTGVTISEYELPKER